MEDRVYPTHFCGDNAIGLRWARLEDVCHVSPTHPCEDNAVGFVLHNFVPNKGELFVGVHMARGPPLSCGYKAIRLFKKSVHIRDIINLSYILTLETLHGDQNLAYTPKMDENIYGTGSMTSILEQLKWESLKKGDEIVES